MNECKEDWLRQRIAKLTDGDVPERLEVITDTTEFMNISRGHVIRLDGKYFFVTGYVYEMRFGLSDEPKYWVKKAINIENGTRQIVKLAHREEFHVRIGRLRIRCYRNPHKEGQVLELVRGNPHFMQGSALFDARGNEVRVLDIIRGNNLYNMILDLKMSHEEYFHTIFPEILQNLRRCFHGIQFLHENGLCHGDIRNDHILIEKDSGQYRWIDFDLAQDFSDFDVWSIGNILQFCVGMGMVTFREVFQSSAFPESARSRLTPGDASAFYEHRIMNLQKLFPYIPDRLNDVLLHFTANTARFYESMAQIIADVDAVLDETPNVMRG